MSHAYRPAWWLPGPHTMTMWGKFFREAALPEMQLTSLPMSDGDRLSVATVRGNGEGPVLLILHGLEGGLRSHYVGGLVRTALALGWQPRLLLFRTCDGTVGPVRRTYHSGETSDADQIIRRFAHEDPTRPMGLVGVSLGGNVLLKWLGESGDAVPPQVRAAMAVSVPFDLAQSSRAIDRGFARLYQWNFLRSLKAKARTKVSQFPDLVPADALERVRTMWEFDDVFTAPLHGFRDAEDYYARSSSIRFLGGIRRPTLLLSAHDDPFYRPGMLDEVQRVSAGNAWLTLEFHGRGGHVGFVAGQPWRPDYYLDARVGTFFREHLDASGERRTA